MYSIIIKKAIRPVSLVLWIRSQVNELDEKLRMLSNPGKIYFICLCFFPLTESKVFKQVVVIKKKKKTNFAYTLSFPPTLQITADTPKYCRQTML